MMFRFILNCALQVFLSCATIVCLYLVYFVNSKKRKSLLKLPGLKPRLLFGNMKETGLFTHSSTSGFYTKHVQLRLGQSLLFKEAGLYVFWVGPWPVVYLTSPKTAEVVLSSNTSTTKASYYSLVKPWLGGHSLLLSSGAKWRHDRKALTPSFHFGILRDFLPVMHEQSTVLVEKLKTLAAEKDWLDPQETVTLCTIDIICETAMGLKLEAQSRTSIYAEAVRETTDSILHRVFRPWLHSDLIFKLVKTSKKFYHFVKTQHDFVEEVITKKTNHVIQNGIQKGNHGNGDADVQMSSKGRLALIDRLKTYNFNPTEMRDHVTTFVFAGHDTTTVTLCWALYMAGLELEAQERLADELNNYLEETGKAVQELTQEDLKGLAYMDRFIKECQRLFPAIPLIGRKMREDVTIGGYLIPKDTEVFVSILSVHRDSESYPNSEKFDPDRFLPENSLGRNPYAFLPFSAGPRNCIGQKYAVVEVKIILCHIISAFTLRSLDPRDKVLYVPELVLRPFGKVRIQFAPRMKA